MSFFKELFSSIRFNARERTTNIYIGSFAFSWGTINWKFWITLLFGEGTVDARIERVSKIINWCDGLIFPIFMSAAICFILPIVNKFIAKFQYEPNNYVKRMNDVSETKSLKRLAGIERLKAKAESARTRENAAQELAIQKLNEQIQESKDNSQQLTAENEKLSAEIIELKNKIIEDNNTYNEVINEKNEIITKLNDNKSGDTTTIETLTKQILDFKNQIDKLKKNIASNTLGPGLPSYSSEVNTAGRIPFNITLKASNRLDSPAVTALNQALQSPTVKAINNAINNPTIKSIKNASESPIAKKIIETSNHNPSQAANASEKVTDSRSTNPTQTDHLSGLKSDNLSDDSNDK
ncbi:hypothetical protein JRA82_003659 [Raoultella ornithinolytica]|nr:hypothetical protein [Raoultella ornithinolytica]HDS7121667.1 hypothetical protein [Klebsiella michiganensis]